MTRLKLSAVLLLAALIGTSCSEEPPLEYDYAWNDFGALANGAHGNAIVALNSNIIVGTDNGVQVYTSTDGQPGTWRQTNLQGVKITGFFVHPLLPNLVIAFGDPNAATNTSTSAVPVYRSTNSGSSWTPASQGLMDEETGLYPPVSSISDKIIQNVQGGVYFVDMYITLGDNAVARSKDDGATWTIVHGDVTYNPDVTCHIMIRQTFLTDMYQACSTTSGETYVDKFNLNSDTGNLPTPTRLFNSSVFSNKKIIGLERTLYSDSIFYVLLEGGVGAIANDEYRWVYEYPNGGGSNTSMTFLWINPFDYNNLVFGGFENGNSSVFAFYDTPNHGRSFTLIEKPSVINLNSPQIMDAYVAGNLGQTLLLLVTGQDGSETVTKVYSRSQVLPD